MKKEEIKADLIHDKIINATNYVLNNKNKFFAYFSSIFILLVSVVFFTNKTEQNRASNNAYSSANQNNYNDGSKELALIGFNNILNDYSKSESYNQALIYVLSDALDNNNNMLIDSLLNNNKFSTNDSFLKSKFLALKGDYFFNIRNFTKAEINYKEAIKLVPNHFDHLAKYTISLVDLYIKDNNYEDALNLIEKIDDDNLSYNYKTKFEKYKYRLNYLSK